MASDCAANGRLTVSAADQSHDLGAATIKFRGRCGGLIKTASMSRHARIVRYLALSALEQGHVAAVLRYWSLR